MSMRSKSRDALGNQIDSLRTEIAFERAARKTAREIDERKKQEAAKASESASVAREQIAAAAARSINFVHGGGIIESAEQARRKTAERYEALLADILLLEPHLKHYQTDGTWDGDRIHAAADHVRGEQALESLGFVPLETAWRDNVISVDFTPTPDSAA